MCMCAHYSITNKQMEFLDDNTLKLILERSDKLAASSLEQLRRSSDRAYTLFGFVLTVFSGVTAYLVGCHELPMLIIGYTLWAGMGVATAMMFSGAIQVHLFKNIGNEPKNCITADLMKAYNTNKKYRHMLLVAAIEENQECYDTNARVLKERAAMMGKVMWVVKATIVVVALLSVVVKLLPL